MGPAAAYNALADPDVARVVVCDVNHEQLATCRDRLAGPMASDRLETALLDVNDTQAAAPILAEADVIIAALPQTLTLAAIRTALAAGVALVHLTSPPDDRLVAVRSEVKAAGGLVVIGCGLEPGLTEIMARHLGEQLDRVDELHIKCGGIPARPTPPLGYKIVFGGRQLPLRASDATMVEAGVLKPVARYSGLERVVFPGVGACEAWHERFMPWLLELPAFRNLRSGTQKTVRWPGYAAKVTILKELGLLSEEPVQVDGVQVVPKRVVDAVLYPQVRLDVEGGDRDLTVFQVDVVGEKDGLACRYRAQMVDRFDERLKFTSMARTTAFTATIIARMIARGDLSRAPGQCLTPEKLITGPLFEQFLQELAEAGIHFEISINP
jgi:lysine 6-dehydrogenase